MGQRDARRSLADAPARDDPWQLGPLPALTRGRGAPGQPPTG
jgi:hypothetical protein